MSGLKLTYHEPSEKAQVCEEVAATYIVLNDVVSRHSSDTELVDLDVDLSSRAAQTGTLGEGGAEVALRRVSVNNAARKCSEQRGLPRRMPQEAGQYSC